MQDASLFPPIEPHRSGMLQVDAAHTLYWEESGRLDGIPVLFLHGGPGGGTAPAHRRFFNPAHYCIVLFDQRGAGRSLPVGEYRDNTTPLLVQDIERLRELLGIERWLLFGGSWGSTLALAYGQAHPERCLGFILRGIFLCTQPEIDWFMHGMRWFFPEVHDAFLAPIPVAERGDLLQAYCRRLFSDDPAVYMPAARSWSRYEAACLFLRPDPEVIDDRGDDATSLAVGRLEAHYFLHGGFIEEDQLMHRLDRIRHLPAAIVQGRYDVVCPPATAHRLHAAWPGARLHVVGDAGHSAFEPGTVRALIEATEDFRRHHAFPGRASGGL